MDTNEYYMNLYAMGYSSLKDELTGPKFVSSYRRVPELIS